MHNSFWDNITNQDIQQLPLLSFSGEIHVIETESAFDEALAELQQHNILGFDTEKKPTFRRGDYNPTALIQLSTIDDAFLFRLNKIGYPPELFDFLADPNILKLGISIDDDLKELQKLGEFEPGNFTDLNSISKELGVKHIGVKKLAAIFLNHRISKGQQTSNWENEVLTESQQRYAATDAWICVKIYNTMVEKGYV